MSNSNREKALDINSQSKDTKTKKPKNKYFYWFIQIYLLLSIAFIIVIYYLPSTPSTENSNKISVSESLKLRLKLRQIQSKNEENKTLLEILKFPALLNLIITYIIYIIISFKNPLFKSLLNKSKIPTIKNFLEKLLNNKPKYNLICNPYHYKLVSIWTRDTNGIRHQKKEKRKIFAKSEKEVFKFSHWKDISGAFIINKSKEKKTKKNFLKLKLNLIFEFADDTTKFDYIKQKENLICRSRFKDEKMDFYEFIDVEDFRKFSFLKVDESDPAFFNLFVFFIFLIFPFMELYKLYVESICLYEEFTIRKIVSSRFDLTKDDYQDKIKEKLPKIYMNESDYEKDEVIKDLEIKENFTFEKTYELPNDEENREIQEFINKNSLSDLMYYQDKEILSPITYSKIEFDVNKYKQKEHSRKNPNEINENSLDKTYNNTNESIDNVFINVNDNSSLKFLGKYNNEVSEFDYTRPSRSNNNNYKLNSNIETPFFNANSTNLNANGNSSSKNEDFCNCSFGNDANKEKFSENKDELSNYNNGYWNDNRISDIDVDKDLKFESNKSSPNFCCKVDLVGNGDNATNANANGNYNDACNLNENDLNERLMP